MSEWYQAHHLSASDRAFVSTDYLTRQLIAYIGNKRRILGFLYRLFHQLGERHRLESFIDPFAGSGAVSRLARHMGMEVYANDWEEYSFLINRAHLRTRPEELDRIFAPWGGAEKLLGELNDGAGHPDRPFISRFYAPRDTAAADYRKERLFYTRENALFIDRVREKIDRLFPPNSLISPEEGDDDAVKGRDLLLALLLYEAATHVNTSGVFKAYHKGFGGHGGDALSRIMTPMKLEMPVLHPSEAFARVENLDASVFLRKHSADLCYLDPPYTVHQYGSNYHLLNTIAKWDFPEVDNELGSDGRLSRKAGIRSDWTRTRSDFCYRKSAPGALREVMAAVDARYVVLSYNSEGIIPLDELLDLLTEYGSVSINSLDYLTYRGGRQSLHRRTYNTEFQIVVERPADTGFPGSREKGEVKSAMTGFVVAHSIMSLLKHTFVPERLATHFRTETGEGPLISVTLIDGESPVVLNTEHLTGFLEFPDMTELQPLEIGELRALKIKLEESACADRQEELQVFLDLLGKADRKKDRDRYQRKILVVLKKFTHKKYISQWTEERSRIRQLVEGREKDFAILRRGLDELERIADLRFNG